MEIASNISLRALVCSPPPRPGDVLHHSLHGGSCGNWDMTCGLDLATLLAAPKSFFLAFGPHTVASPFSILLNVIIYYHHLLYI